MPNYATVFEVRSHFSRFHVWLSCMRISIVSHTPGQQSNPPSSHPEASNKQQQPTKGPQEIRTTICGLCLFLCYKLGIYTKFCSGIQELVLNFVRTKFCHSKFRTFLIFAASVCLRSTVFASEFLPGASHLVLALVPFFWCGFFLVVMLYATVCLIARIAEVARKPLQQFWR